MGDSSDRKPTPTNGTLFQSYEWNTPSKHYPRLLNQIDQLTHIGITALWLPPACKASSPEGNGYDIYDLYDLGEFDQKGSRSTKWGSVEELKELCKKCNDNGIAPYFDAVLNHKAAADKTETCKVVEVDPDDRTKVVSGEFEIEGWLGFEFEGRGGRYSEMKYHWYHFSGTDYDQRTQKKAIYKIVGDNKGWSESVDKEQGNADYMMFADVDYSHPEVQEDVKRWGPWVTKELGLKGFRLDAVQHFSERFTKEWADRLREECGSDIFLVGEYWIGDTQRLSKWLDIFEKKFAFYDAPLVYQFSNISKQEKADLRKVFDGSFVAVEPTNAVTVVMNHDTQPGQTVETPIEGFFKPLAYSLILLRQEGYPSVFYGDLYGMKGRKGVDPSPPSCNNQLSDIILARKLYAYGEQDDYFDAANCIGWVRKGTWDKPYGLACVMSNAEENEKRMFLGEEHKGELWTDVLGWAKGEVKIGDDGYGMFTVPATSVAIWVNKDAEGRDGFGKFDSDIYKGE